MQKMKQSKSNIVILILGMIVAVLVAAVIILQVTDNGKNPAGGPDRTDSMLLNTPSPELSASPKEETETPSAATATAPATAAPSATLSEATPSATYTEGNFGFLEGISRDYFEDAKAEDGGSWYPGAVQRQSDGTVVYKWDRYASTLRTLEKYDAIYRKNTDQKVVYLTFDCGYENGYTARILDILKEKDVKAIFFVTGDYLNDKSTKEIVLRMLSEGHLIGNHTDRHPNMTQVSDEEFVKQLRNVEAKLKAIAGGEAAMSYYRPPEGASTERDLCLAKHLGYTSVFWSFAHYDFNPDQQPDITEALAKTKSSLHDGAVYLLHAVSSTNTAILGDLIDYMRAEGYEIRRIDQ